MIAYITRYYSIALILMFCIEQRRALAYTTPANWLTTSILAREEEQASYEYTLQPKSKINLEITTGNITLESWGKQQVVVQVTKHARTREELANNPLAIKNDPKSLVISTIPEYQHIITDVAIMVPGNAAVTILINQAGDCIASSAPRTLKIHTMAGTIDVTTHTDGNINAATENGSIQLICEAFSPESSLMLSAPRGGITLSLPPLVSARLDAVSQRGTILSPHFPIIFDSFTSKLEKNSWKQLQKKAKGYIGEKESEAPITLLAQKNIIIRALD